MDKEQLLTLLDEKREYTAILPELLSIIETEKSAVKYQAEKRCGSSVRQIPSCFPRTL